MKVTPKIKKALSRDPVMENIIKSVTLSESSSQGNVYHDLIRSITAQQLSTKVAQVIYQRFLSIFDGVEPEPHELLDTDHEALRSIGYSNQKAKYIKNVAEFFTQQSLDLAYWQSLSDVEVMDKLTSIKGVGKWTTEMIQMFTLERPDILPVDDLGIQMAMKQFYQFEADKKELKNRMIEIAEAWRPYRTYASMYLWAGRDNVPIK